MENQHESFEHEINDLKMELEHFEQEKERVRAIIGKIGGVPRFSTKLINFLFIAIIIVAGIISIFSGERLRLLMIELTTVMLSVKIIYMIHYQMRVNHFKFWILSAIEWRINEMMVRIKKIEKQ
jgi:ABC-type multidrug transport system fused ATPase/permease subunit